MFIPGLVIYLAFKYFPMGGLIIAFKDYNFFDGVFRSPWVGWENFRLMFQNPHALLIIRNTFVLSFLSLIFGFPAAIILALMINEIRHSAYKRLVQTAVYLPHFFSWVIISGMVFLIFAIDTGIVNRLLVYLGGSSIPFLYKPAAWITIFVGSGVWKDTGFNAIIYLAALSAINPSLYEAASIDGASKMKQMFHVTIPGIFPTIVVIFILSVGRVMEVGFDQVYNLQTAVVSNVSEVISTYIYRVGLQGAQYSLTTALGLFESLVGFVLVLFANWMARRSGGGLW